MKSYHNAISAAINSTVNMPNAEAYPAKFIVWAEDICILISEIYEKDYEQVCEDLQDALGLLDDNE